MDWEKFKKLISNVINSFEITIYKDSNGYEKMSNKQDKYIKAIREQFPYIYLYGNVGVGKTYQMKKLYNNLTYVKYVKWSDLVEYNLRKLRNEELTDYEKYTLNYKTGDFYIIDDFLTSNISQTQMELLFKIIDYRTENKMITWITGNYNLNKISELLSIDSKDPIMRDRILSRLKLFHFVEAKGIDKRGVKNGKN